MEVSWNVEVDPVVFPRVVLVTGNGFYRLLTDAGTPSQNLEVAFLGAVLEKPEVDAVLASAGSRRHEASFLVVMSVSFGVDVGT